MVEPSTKKILIVDDEAYIRLLIEQSLEELEDQGVVILTADNGADALQIIQEEMPQLVFLDVMIPRINGFDVCRRVKLELKMDQVHIILLTAKGQEFDRQIGEEAGADVYMTKPFDPDELISLATTVLGK
jgi:DNA-binding response OmpR family regulator